MKKYIKDASGYFKFINKNKDKIDVIRVKSLKKSIVVEYEKREFNT